MDDETAERIQEFKQKTNVMLDSLNPRVQLPDFSLPDIKLAASKGAIATLSDWWCAPVRGKAACNVCSNSTAIAGPFSQSAGPTHRA